MAGFRAITASSRVLTMSRGVTHPELENRFIVHPYLSVLEFQQTICCDFYRSNVVPATCVPERSHNKRALSDTMQGDFFLKKKPPCDSGFGVQQLWNRCHPSLV